MNDILPITRFVAKIMAGGGRPPKAKAGARETQQQSGISRCVL